VITSSRLAALAAQVLAILSFAEWIDLDFILPFFFVAADDSYCNNSHTSSTVPVTLSSEVRFS
jgi:hypothetical protein